MIELGHFGASDEDNLRAQLATDGLSRDREQIDALFEEEVQRSELWKQWAIVGWVLLLCTLTVLILATLVATGEGGDCSTFTSGGLS